jgi:hypothetical protein
VLAVDGKQQPSTPRLRRERELARRDETLLVRERKRDAALERPESRRETREADDGVQHDIGLGAVEQLGQVAPDLRQRREAVDRLGAGRGRDKFEPGVGRDDLERLAADRARRPEKGDPRHLLEVYDWIPPADYVKARIV